MPFGSVVMKVSLHPEHMFLEEIGTEIHLQSGSVNFLTIMLLANANNRKLTETLAHGYSSERTQQQLSNEYKV